MNGRFHEIVQMNFQLSEKIEVILCNRNIELLFCSGKNHQQQQQQMRCMSTIVVYLSDNVQALTFKSGCERCLLWAAFYCNTL